jgi:predicted transcriptional regulator YheO
MSEITSALFLESLKRKIKDKCTAFEQESITFGRLSLHHAREMGELFSQAKEKVKQQGQKWQPWLNETCTNINVRTVGLYMQVAKNYDDHLATVVANDEDFTLKDAQELLNKISPRKPREQKPSKVNLLANIERAAGQYQEVLNQLLDTDLNSETQKDVATILQILNDTGSLNLQVHKKLETHQLPSAANEIASGQIDCCPICNKDLTFGLKSCLSCGWNMGEIPATFAPEDFGSFLARREFVDN